MDLEIVHQIGYTQIKILFKMPQKMSVTKVFSLELGLTQHYSLSTLLLHSISKLANGRLLCFAYRGKYGCLQMSVLIK